MKQWFYYVGQNDKDEPVVYDVAKRTLRQAKDYADQILSQSDGVRIVWCYRINGTTGRPDFGKAVYITRLPF